MTVLIHVANVLFLCSYLVRDILWLRMLTIVAIGALIPYYFANDLMAPIAWNGVFLAINFYQVWRLLLERRPVHLDARQQRLYRRTFAALKPREFLNLANAGEWVSLDPGQEILAAGAVLDRLRVIEDGRAQVRTEADGLVAELGPGRLIGEMSFITGDATSASVVAEEPTTLLCWERSSLDRLLANQPSIKAALQLVIGSDMAAKLRA